MEHLKSCRVAVVGRSFKYVKKVSSGYLFICWSVNWVKNVKGGDYCEFMEIKNKANYLLESKPFSKCSAQESLLFCKKNKT